MNSLETILSKTVERFYSWRLVPTGRKILRHGGRLGTAASSATPAATKLGGFGRLMAKFMGSGQRVLKRTSLPLVPPSPTASADKVGTQLYIYLSLLPDSHCIGPSLCSGH